MGDFLGFEFGGISSQELGITRVSGGDRYDEELQPEIKDITAEVPGMDGEYYFGSTFGTRTFEIEIAYDSLTEEQFRNLKRIFGTKDIKKLIFDERPYKYYMVKIESPIELSYICFDEPKKHIDRSGNAQGIRWVEQTREIPIIDEETGEPTGETEIITERVRETLEPYVYDNGTQRIYKGEGKISFKAYFPFAKSVYKVLPTAEEESDWAVSSRILTAVQYRNIDTYSSGAISVYNAGDINTGFRLYLPAAVCATPTTLTYKADNLTTTAQLILDEMTLKENDIGVLIDTNSQLIIGVSEFGIDQSGNNTYTTSGNLYNQYVNSGYFFQLELNLLYDYSTIEITGGDEGIYIFYDYLYF